VDDWDLEDADVDEDNGDDADDGAGGLTRDAHQAAMTDLIAESVNDPQLQSRNPAAFRLHQKKIHGHAKAICEIDQTAEDDAVAVRLERMERGLPGNAPYGEAAELERRRQEAVEELKLLAALGFEGAEEYDTENIEQWEVASLKMRRLATQGDYEALASEIAEQMRTVEATPASIDLVHQFAAADLDPSLKAAVADQILVWLFDAHSSAE